jgi:hypothetical protein
VKSFTAAGYDEGPSFGMYPPNQLRSEDEVLTSGGFAEPLICFFFVNQLHVPAAVPAPSES